MQPKIIFPLYLKKRQFSIKVIIIVNNVNY
jgi:hypothetical protein